MKKHQTIQAGKFKSICLKLMDQVQDNGISIIITKHGKPIAKLVPVDTTPTDFSGCLKGTITQNGDIIAPIDVEWEANK